MYMEMIELDPENANIIQATFRPLRSVSTFDYFPFHTCNCGTEMWNTSNGTNCFTYQNWHQSFVNR